MSQRQTELKNTRILVVTFEDLERAEIYEKLHNLGFPLLIDPDRQLYQHYGMGRGTFGQVWTPRGILRFLKGLFARRKNLPPASDIYQMGGDVLIDPDGVVRYVYLSKTSEDRPSVDEIVGQLER